MSRKPQDIELKAEVVDREAPPARAFVVVERARSSLRKVLRGGFLQDDDADMVDVPVRKTWWSRHRPNGYLLSFILLVILPSIVSVAYLTFIAADQYVAEARFAVRSLQSEAAPDKLISALSSLTGGMGSQSGQDPYIVTSYIHSRAIVDDLAPKLNLREIFTRPEADYWAELKPDATAEELVKYWSGMISTYVDAPSGIVTISARAFRPDDALVLAREILAASEKLVNAVSARARADAMAKAEQEVRRYEAQVRDALVDLRKFRDSEGFIDPAMAATSTSKLVLQAMAEKIRLQNELFVGSRAMSADAPSVQTTKLRIESLDKQIDQLKAQLTGNAAGRTVSNSLVRFEELELKRVFAEKLYSMAQDALERARVRTEQQSLYVSVFVPPSLPEDPKYPERFSLSLIIPAAFLVLWAILAMISAAVHDHRL